MVIMKMVDGIVLANGVQIGLTFASSNHDGNVEGC